MARPDRPRSARPPDWRIAVRRAIPGADDDLIDEVAGDLGDRWIRARDSGASRDEADRLVARELDGWRGVQPERRRPRRRRGRVLHGWSVDARHAVRSLRVRPAFTLAAALLTAIAVMINVGVFAVAYGVLWRPLPYPDSERLVVLWQVERGEQGQVSYPDYRDLTTASVFDGASILAGGRGSIRVGDEVDRVNALEVEPEGLRLLGATAWMGRLLAGSDAGRPHVMISHRLWRTRLNADPSVVGSRLWMSGREYTIVGVLPAGFDFELPVGTFRLERHDVWSIFDPSSPFVQRRDVSTYQVLARLTAAATLGSAQAAMDALGARLATTHPATNHDRGFRVAGLRAHTVAPVRRPLLLACLTSAGALLVALGNLLTLTLVRHTERSAEIAIRQALGAGTLRLRRQLFTEYALVCGAGAVAGYFLAGVAVQAFLSSEAAHLPRADAVRFDTPVRWLATALAAAIGVAMSALPLTARASSSALRTGCRAAGHKARATRRALVGVELGVAIALAGAGVLLALSVGRLTSVDPGFSPEGVASVRVSAYQNRYPSLERMAAFVGRILEDLGQQPQIESVAAGSSLPLSGQSTGTGVLAEGRPIRPGSRQPAGWQYVTPRYFRTLGMPLTAGRDFTHDDLRHDGHVTIVNEALARALFAGENPVGRRITTGDGDAHGDWHEIVGVVGDVRHHALDTSPAPRVYDLFGEHWGRTMYVVARSRAEDTSALLPAMRGTVAALDREAPVFEAATLTSLAARSAAPYRLAATLAAGVAAAALALALIGVYAVSAASVSERTQEIGIRAALGAAPRDLLRMVLGDGARTAAAGAAVGLFGGWMAARALGAHLFEVRVVDMALTIPTVGALLTLIALAATLPAAWRAARVDPTVAIRTD